MRPNGSRRCQTGENVAKGCLSRLKRQNGVKQGQTGSNRVKQNYDLTGKQGMKQTVMIFFSRRIYTPVLVSFYHPFFLKNRHPYANQLYVAEEYTILPKFKLLML